MNKMQGLAKTLITLFGIYWLILIGLSFLQSMIMIFSIHRNKSLAFVLPAVLIMFFVIFLLILQILYRRDKIAVKIAGSEELTNVDAQVKWIPFAFRLTAIIAGMYCFFRVASYIPMLVNTFRHIQSLKGHSVSGAFGPEKLVSDLIIVCILLIAGIYLLCGAPHFVRWQVKKTMETCIGN